MERQAVCEQRQGQMPGAVILKMREPQTAHVTRHHPWEETVTLRAGSALSPAPLLPLERGPAERVCEQGTHGTERPAPAGEDLRVG